MDQTFGNFLDFLDSVYGRGATDQICSLSGMDRDEVRKASALFTPAFLQSLMAAKQNTAPAAGDAATLGSFFSPDLQKAMQDVMSQGLKTAQSFAPASKQETLSFPFNVFAEQGESLDQLYQTFMSQMAQARLMDEMGKATGLDATKMRKLFPMLTAFGLMPLMPPSADDPAGWVDYLGELGRANMRRANKELDAMPNPLNAAFDGLLAGFYPDSVIKEPSPTEVAEDKMEELKEASLVLQTNYIKGLNSLFEQMQPGIDKSKNEDDESA